MYFLYIKLLAYSVAVSPVPNGNYIGLCGY